MSDEPEHLRKSLRLYLSVDIAGSTAYKSLQPEKVQPWLPTLYRFFQEFPIRLVNAYTSVGEPPRLWKTLGDEMVFVTEIRNHRDVAKHICRFRDTIAGYREVIKDASRRLDLKGSAWLAGFPVGNTVIRLQQGTQTEPETEDYIGPSIDCGFRLAKHSTPHKLVLSIETAYLLQASGAPDGTEKPDVYLERGEELKGVLDGRPYPCLWVNVPYRDNEKFHRLEAELMDPPKERKEGKIRDYCRSFIEEYGTPLFVPFIEGDSDFGKMPADYQERLDEVCKLWQEGVKPHRPAHEASGATLPVRSLEAKLDAIGKPKRKRTKDKKHP